MLKRLRRKFVLICVLSLALVLAVLVTGINAGIRYFDARSADSLLLDIAEHGGRIPGPEIHPPQQPWDYPVTEETPFETRYFAVRVDSDGNTSVELDFISAIDGESALKYLDDSMKSGSGSGYVGRYRFLKYGDGEDTLYLFLDCTRQQRAQELILLVSCAGSLAVLAATALVLFLLSRRAISPITQSVERQKRFITDAGHELKTPITAIMAAADVLALDEPDNEWIVSIRHESSRLAKLTADLIELSRCDEAAPFPDREVFDLSAELSGLCEAFSLTAGAKGHAADIEIAPGVRVDASREALRRAAGILLDNALRYSDEGGSITVSLRKRHGRAVLEVSNLCSGMTRETLSRMFERFYRGDSSRTGTGSGIGLSMAQAIIDAHGGQISAKYASGRVSLIVSLPAE